MHPGQLAIAWRSSAKTARCWCFPLTEVPELARGKGVRLQRYKDGGVADIRIFTMEQGLTWQDASGRSFTRGKLELLEWAGPRATAGRMVPKGFPRSGKFS